MRIATSTNLISFNRDGSKTEMVHLLPLYAKEGFRVLDLNLCEMLNPKASLAGEQWKEYAERLGQLRHQHTLVFNQAHAPYARSGEILEDMLKRALQICHLLGIPILVVHPIPGTIEENHAAFLPYLKVAEAYRVMLAFENLNEEGELTDIPDLIALVDGFASPFVGICYDTGHAHMCTHDMTKDITMMGSRLVATHIADNKGESDEHLLPFYGTIDWEAVLAALSQIGYQGDLTYECMFFNQHLPLQLKVQAIRQAKLIGDFLLSRVP